MLLDSIVVNSMPVGYQCQCLLVTSTQILGLNVSSDLKWNCHFDFIIKKAIKMLWPRYGCTHRLVQITSTLVQL